MRNRLATGLCAGLASLPALATTPTTLDDVLQASGITASGHLSASYTDGFNSGQLQAYRAFDSDSNSFIFNQAMLILSRLPEQGIGGTVTLLAGNDAQVVNLAYGDCSSDCNSKFSLEQAYLQYARGAFTIIGGRYVTLAGAEVIDDSADTNISRSLLFQLAEPLVHTGARASYKLGIATFYLGVNNGVFTGNASDTNQQKTLETGVWLAPSSAISLGVYDYFSHEGGAGLNFFDAVASYQVTERLQFVVNTDWFSSHSSATPGAFAYGFAGYLNYAIDDAWKASLRGEYLQTKNVVACPKSDGKCNVSEITATLGYSPLKHLTLLAELRYDFSDQSIFPDPSFPGPKMSDNQGNVALKAIYSF
ncbi:MAG: porin [Gammaproteobacteria bacterium]|nr:porin [Gammaproteobacteria bacterium]